MIENSGDWEKVQGIDNIELKKFELTNFNCITFQSHADDIVFNEHCGLPIKRKLWSPTRRV